MAYPSLCKPCLNGDCENCEETFNKPPPGYLGGGFCVCSHGEEENAFQKRVREKLEEKGRGHSG